MIQSIEIERKEDGPRSIADKIIKRLHDLEMTVENNHGRWAWELLQNAKDSIADNDRKVSVEIELSRDSVVFRHNGSHFTQKDIRGLINQISSKEVEEGQESSRTGKFGTGFLTTHLLSKIVEVEGIVKTVDEEYYRFSFQMDRNGNTTGQLVPKIENAWTAFHESTEDNKIDEYDEDDFNTSFTYNLVTKEQKDIARIGVNELTELIPFVLAFIPVIDSVNIIDSINNKTTKFENSEIIEDDVLLTIIKTENKKKIKIKILFAEDNNVAIASIVEETKDGYAIKSLNDYPKLFCDFPLIGTEDFHFPVIVNSFYFNPLIERDGVWLKGDDKQEVDENREIIEKAVKLYGQLVERITDLNFYDYYNICLNKTPNTNHKYFDEKWYQNNVQKVLREVITNSKVIETEDDKVLFSDVSFPDPDLKKEDREKIWQFSSDLKAKILPAKKHIHKWADLIWNDCSIIDFENIATDLSEINNITDLQNCLRLNIENTIKWLQSIYDFLIGNKCTELFNELEIVPNRLGAFQKVNEVINKRYDSLRKQWITNKQLIPNLYLDELNDDILLDIFALIGLEDWREYLVYEGIDISALTSAKIDIQNISSDITLGLKEKKVYDENTIKAVRLLSEWFDNNEDIGKKHFQELYKNRAKLFLDTIDDKDSLYRIMKSNISLSKLSEITLTIENDPEILNLIAKRKKEIEEEKDRNEVGEKVENILAETLQKHGFEVKKEIFGKDLIITLKKKNIRYAIEVKSTSRSSYVSMTSYQAETAVTEADNYALCVVQKNGSVLNTDYIRKNSKFVTNIGEKLKMKFDEVSEFETNKMGIANTNDDIDLYYENDLIYKYKISNNIWSKGKIFGDFIDHINKI
ncbi:sacsin N-terminal ATP-binding-like domain-containing protein [Acetobacteroides hydrogenigenes]|uniref:Uncharacterized protein n=1 Tax=Acetobacteroides hydrogenigenes TaxID=979970 RepID=A0A4R2EDN3_9BACT|nr:ATP-binding protein [Acetobacteroides hydrogenigenes]TCN66421.1 hypothetical protein CLV25_10950 [Acetobacteroides hydrogenigenes]